MSRKRPRVRLRPKVRSKRRSVARIGFAVLFFAASVSAFVWFRPWQAWSSPSLESVPGSELIRVRSIRVAGVPDDYAAKMLDRIDWRPGSYWGPRRPTKEARSLLEEFPSLKTVRVTRSWSRKSVVFEARLREPVAAVAGGTEERMLDGSGVIFSAPEGILSREGLPEVELDGVPEGFDLEPLARLIGVGRKPGALPAPLIGVRFVSEEAGWEGFLADGTFLEWGRLEWTGPKLRRLRQVLEDAGPRLEGTLTADLKHFEDGKILIRPH